MNRYLCLCLRKWLDTFGEVNAQSGTAAFDAIVKSIEYAVAVGLQGRP